MTLAKRFALVSTGMMIYTFAIIMIIQPKYISVIDTLNGVNNTINESVSTGSTTTLNRKEFHHQITIFTCLGVEGSGHHGFKEFINLISKKIKTIKNKRMDIITESELYPNDTKKCCKTISKDDMEYIINFTYLYFNKTNNYNVEHLMFYVMAGASYPCGGLQAQQYPNIPLLTKMIENMNNNKSVPIYINLRYIVLKRSWVSAIVSSCIHRFGFCKQRVEALYNGSQLIDTQLKEINPKYWIMIDYLDILQRSRKYAYILSQWLNINDVQLTRYGLNCFYQSKLRKGLNGSYGTSKMNAFKSAWNKIKRWDAGELIPPKYKMQYQDSQYTKTDKSFSLSNRITELFNPNGKYLNDTVWIDDSVIVKPEHTEFMQNTIISNINTGAKCAIIFVDICRDECNNKVGECTCDSTRFTWQNIAMNKPLTNNAAHPLICNENNDMFQYILITSQSSWTQRTSLFEDCPSHLKSNNYNVTFDKVIFFQDIMSNNNNNDQLNHLDAVKHIGKLHHFKKGEIRFKRIIIWKWILDNLNYQFLIFADSDVLFCNIDAMQQIISRFNSKKFENFEYKYMYDIGTVRTWDQYGACAGNRAVPNPHPNNTLFGNYSHFGFVFDLRKWRPFPERNCGFILIHSNENTKQLFNIFYSSFMDQMLTLYKYKIVGDQCALRQALFILNDSISEMKLSLDNICRGRYGCENKKCVVSHRKGTMLLYPICEVYQNHITSNLATAIPQKQKDREQKERELSH